MPVCPDKIDGIEYPIEMKSVFIVLVALIAIVSVSCDSDSAATTSPERKVVRELNADAIARGDGLFALLGGTLIDGKGGEPLANSCIIVRNDRIEVAGPGDEVEIPEGAEVTDISGLTVLPGLIDAHYHDEDSDTLTSLYLRNGVTSVRDPGEWIESYAKLRASGKKLPRLFLAGPHLDHYPPAYPADSYIVNDAEEARIAVDNLAAQGSTVIKVYYGLPLGTIREVCDAAREYGLPVTAHLEITNAKDAINAGLDGIEHITSFGTCLIPMREVEIYKQKVMADKNARRRGRYEVWNSIDLTDNPQVDSLIEFLSGKQTFVSPTLAVFERRSDRGDSVDVGGFTNMMKFVGMANAGGVRIVVGSHSYVPYADLGLAFHREMELLKEAGLTNMQVIQAATMQNAKFLRVEDRLGSIEAGKIADLVIIEGNPLEDITAMRRVKRVMLNGACVE
jgi:imidazolonepropionase-like amidohydrolase